MSTCNSKVATCAEKQNRVGEGERFMVVCTEQSERRNSRRKSKVELTGHYQVDMSLNENLRVAMGREEREMKEGQTTEAIMHNVLM